MTEQLNSDFGVGANMKSSPSYKQAATARPDMVDLSEMVGKVQMEAVVSDVGNRIVAMDEDIDIAAIDKLRTDIVAMKKIAISR